MVIDDPELLPVSDASTVLYSATVSADDPIMVAATREGIALVRLQTGTSEPARQPVRARRGVASRGRIGAYPCHHACWRRGGLAIMVLLDASA